jgi:hypothetical protein
MDDESEDRQRAKSPKITSISDLQNQVARDLAESPENIWFTKYRIVNGIILLGPLAVKDGGSDTPCQSWPSLQ